jgi:type IV pilus assembly protein PilV
MALTVLAIGISGIVAMQKITVASNQHARSLAVATHVAQAWQEQLATDAVQWNHPSPNVNLDDLPQTRWLSLVGTGWFQPGYDATLDFGPGFDALGNVVTVANIGQAVFCTNLRMTWLYPANAGNGLIRTEVRVFWVREGMGGTVDGNPVCSGADPADIEQNSDRYHFVYQTSAVKQNTAP